MPEILVLRKRGNIYGVKPELLTLLHHRDRFTYVAQRNVAHANQTTTVIRTKIRKIPVIGRETLNIAFGVQSV